MAEWGWGLSSVAFSGSCSLKRPQSTAKEVPEGSRSIVGGEILALPAPSTGDVKFLKELRTKVLPDTT